MAFKQHWFRYLCAFVIPLVVGLCALERPRTAGVPAYYAQKAWSAPARVKHKAADEVKALVLKRIEHYREQCDDLNRNVYYWVLLVGLTILILSQRKEDGIELMGIKIPAGARHLVVVVSMLYLWIDFGGTLKALIYERMALWKLIDTLEGLTGEAGTVPLTSLRPLLLGKPFLDWWFREFLPEFSMTIPNGQQNSSVNQFLFVASRGAVATMIGLAHASAFVMLDDARLVWARRNKLIKYGLPPLQVFCVVIIVLCYLYFQMEGHGGPFFFLCSIAAGLGIVLLPGIKLLRAKEPLTDPPV